MRKLLFAALAYLALAFTPAQALTCNPPSGWLIQDGVATVGDFIIFGPDCGHLQDAGPVLGGTLTSANNSINVVLTAGNYDIAINLAHTNVYTASQTFSAGASVAGLTVTASLTATGLVTNADLVNPSMTVNGTLCTLGGSCAPAVSATSITPGTTTILGATAPCAIENSATTVMACTPETGTGSFVKATNPSIATLTVTAAFTATGLVTNADLVNSSLTVNGTSCTLGGSCAPTAAASSITPGTTTIIGATAPCAINNSATTVMACTAETGTGSFVLATNATLVAPLTLNHGSGVGTTGVEFLLNFSGTTAPALISAAVGSIATGIQIAGQSAGATPSGGSNIQINSALNTQTTEIYSPSIIFVAAQGLASAPTALGTTTVMGTVGGWGYDGTSFTTNLHPAVSMQFTTTQAWSVTAHGTEIDFFTTPNGSLVQGKALTIGQDKSLTLFGNLVSNITGSIQCVQASALGVFSGTGASCGGSGTPGGATTDIQFANAGAFAGDSGFTYAGAGGVVTLTPAANTAQPMLITGGSITGSGTGRLGYSVVGTLNTTGAPIGYAYFANITVTAAAVNASMMEIQAGGLPVFTFNQNAQIVFRDVTGAGATNFTLLYTATSSYEFLGINGVSIIQSARFAWSNGNSASTGDDTALARNAAGVVEVNNNTNGTLRELTARSFLMGGATPTASGTCAVTTQVGGNTAGKFTASGACVAGTYILTFGFTATNGWACDAQDQTTPTDTIKQTGVSATSATFAATTANADVVNFKCLAY